jgi:hypothetical protein
MERDVWQLDRNGKTILAEVVIVEDYCFDSFSYHIVFAKHSRYSEILRCSQAWEHGKTARNRAHWLLLSMGFFSHNKPPQPTE